MKLLVLNGPNLNLLGLREPEIYGSESYGHLCSRIQEHAKALAVEVTIRQTNHEGTLVDWIQEAYGVYDGIIINPAAYTHTSVAILDAVKAVGLPTVEVHLSDTTKREAFRQISYIRSACVKTIQGHGIDGYLEAMTYLVDNISKASFDHAH